MNDNFEPENAFSQEIKPVNIGSPIDAEVRVTLSGDNMEALLFIEPEKNGGKAATLETVKRALELNGVRFGVDERLLERIFETQYFGKSLVVAKGVPPVDGDDGTITYRFTQNLKISPKEDEYGIVDYRDLGLITNIKAGTEIADIVQPTNGEAGRDTRGVEIPPKPGRKAIYGIGTGTAMSDDGLHIVARVDGNLRWNKSVFVVDETVRIGGDVDASTGNISFMGDVVIKGEVGEGFEIRSDKNITIGGNATGAKLIAGGNIKIGQGAINSVIICEGSMKTGFAENSNITCKGNLTSQSFVGCTVMCEGELTAVGGKGVIVGGKYTCLKSITTNCVGSVTFAKTYITLGNSAILAEEKIKIQEKIEKYKEQVKQLIQVYDILCEQKRVTKMLPPDREEMLMNAIKSRYAIQGEVKNQMMKLQEIDISLENTQDLSLTCKKELFPGTTIRINTAVSEIDVGAVRCKVIRNDEGLIEIKPLNI